MILCFYFCITSGYYFFKNMTSRILGPGPSPGPTGPGPTGPGPTGPGPTGPGPMGPGLGPRALGPCALGPLETRGTPRILEILPPPVPTRAWAEISQSGQPLTGTIPLSSRHWATWHVLDHCCQRSSTA